MLTPAVRRVLLNACVSIFLHAAVSAQVPTAGYNSPWRNADGSLKLALEFGGGANASIGPTRHDEDHGWNYRMGAGYNFNRRVGVSLEYSFNHATTPRSYLIETFPANVLANGGRNNGLTGSVHLWSLTAEPRFHYFDTEKYGGYVLAGGGLYRKVTMLEGGLSLESCFEYLPLPCLVGNTALSNNAGGVNLGTGLSWRPDEHSNAKLFVDVRYVWVDNQQSPSNTLYPAANERTSFVPISAGVHW
jgi:hypothetical protein